MDTKYIIYHVLPSELEVPMGYCDSKKDADSWCRFHATKLKHELMHQPTSKNKVFVLKEIEDEQGALFFSLISYSKGVFSISETLDSFKAIPIERLEIPNEIDFENET